MTLEIQADLYGVDHSSPCSLDVGLVDWREMRGVAKLKVSSLLLVARDKWCSQEARELCLEFNILCHMDDACQL